MKRFSCQLFAALCALLLCFSSISLAQDAGQVLRLSVGYRTLKNSLPLSDEKRQAVEALEAKARDANNDKKYGEAYKHYSHAIALIRNQAWTPVRALNTALQVKAEKLIFDPNETARLTLTQLYTLDEPLAGKLNGTLTLTNKNGQEEIKQLRPLTEMTPDFTSATTIEAALPDVPDGDYQLALKLKSKDGEEITKAIPIRIARGLNAQAAALKTRAATIKADLQKRNQTSLLLALPTVEYAATMIDLVNDGQLAVERTDVKATLSQAAARLDQIAKGEHPLKAARGDFHWAYRSAVDDTVQPYRLFVPSKYDATKKWPLVVALHGMGGDENSFFTAYNNGEIRRIAETRGYLVVTPKGRQPASMYFGAAEQDVIDVIKEMKREFSIDEDRVYIMGHSMGGYGSWSIAVNHPDLFAAIAPIAGGGNPFVTAKLRGIAHVPWIVVHGDKDPTVPVSESRKMVKAGEAMGIKIKYIEVPGGDHSNIVVPNLNNIFDWFDAHKRQPKSAAKAAGSER
jgi:predicted esterase